MLTIDVRWLNTSGIGTYLRNILPGIILSFPDRQFCLLGNLVDMAKIQSFNNSNVHLLQASSAMYSLKEQLEIIKIIPKETSLFWATHYNIPLLYQGRIVVSVYDMFHLAMPEFVGGLSKRLYAKAQFSAVRHRASAILTISEFTKNEFHRLTGAAKQPIYPIHLGVAEEWFNIPVEVSPHPKPYLLFVGNVKPHKNLVALVKAFSLIHQKVPHDLMIVGKKEGFITGDDIVAAEAAKLGQRVCFTGRVSDEALQQYVAHASALIFPSLYEGFGLPPLEAMAAGCPVLVSRAASLPEVCGDAAVYFDPLNAQDIADTMLSTLCNPSALSMLRMKGLQVAKSFRWDATVEKTCNVIRGLL